MTAAIKICGVTEPIALDAAIAARAEHVGFMFFAPSPRHLGFAAAAALAARAEARTGRVGVFVDPDDTMLGEAVTAGRLSAIQLHGAEPPARTAAIRARFALPVWKAVAVRGADDVAGAARYHGAADLVLFDAKPPAGSDRPGGLGLRFDWSLLSGWQAPLPWGLSGGLDRANVAEAIRATRAPLVDVSSGVESAPGVKDVDKIAAFCHAVREYEDAF